MNVHIGSDSEIGLIISVETTVANVHALTPAADLLYVEVAAYSDFGYQGIERRDEKVATFTWRKSSERRNRRAVVIRAY